MMAKQKKSGKSQPGRLRIVAGNWRSRLLDVADVPGLRPTSQRIRETLFNWLATRLPGTRCLDLFAGTGALGLEALSRGAREVVFVERAALAVATLEKNAAALEAVGATVLQMDAAAYLNRDHEAGFDIVFLDPPFGDDRLEELCRLLEQQHVLAPNALVYLEQDKSQPEVELPQGWRTLKNKTAGNVRYMLVQATQ
jgi:16S rRNA (guanine966-N2)-methyltransferase